MENYNLTQTGSEVQALLNKIDALPTNATLQQSLTTLQNNINAEATTRGNNDTTLQGNINAEKTARENADTALQASITLITDVLPQALAELQAAIDGLKANLQDLGDVKAENIDLANLPKVCGYPLVVEGAGAPADVPYFVGQRYHDTTNKKVYEAFSVTNSTADWVLLN